MISYVRAHGWLMIAGILALLFGIACISPNILQRFDAQYPFQGVEFMGADQEHYYASRVREMYDGHWSAGNVYRRPKDLPYLQPPLPEATIATVGITAGLTAAHAFIVAKVILGAALFFVLLFFTRGMFGHQWISLVAVTALLFAGSVFASPHSLLRALTEFDLPADTLRFSRGINPQWSSTWFFVTLLFLIRWMQHRSRSLAIAAGICTAVCLYSYVYAWTYLGATIFPLLLWYAWRREWKRCNDLLVLGAVFGILGVPYFLHLYGLLGHPWYTATSARQGLVHMREPVFGIFALALPVIALALRSSLSRLWPLLLSLGLGGIVALNQQLITGQFLVPPHYHWYFIFPIASVTLIVSILLFARNFLPHVSKGAARPFLFFVIIASVGIGFLQQKNAYASQRELWGELQRAAPSYEALSAYGSGTVLANMQTSRAVDLIPVYTSLDTYDADNANNYLTPFERVQHTFFLTMWLQNLSFEDASVRFFGDLRATLSGRLYGLHYRELSGSYEDIPDDLVEKHLDDYREFLNLPFAEKIRYPLDFALFTPFDERTPAWDTLFSAGTVVFERDGYVIIDLRPLSLGKSPVGER